MKVEIEKEINSKVEQELIGLNPKQLHIAKALCRAAYYMGYDNGKAAIELINADQVLAALNPISNKLRKSYENRRINRTKQD